MLKNIIYTPLFLVLLAFESIQAQSPLSQRDSIIFYSQIKLISNIKDTIPFDEQQELMPLKNSINLFNNSLKKIYCYRKLAKFFAEQGNQNLANTCFSLALSHIEPASGPDIRAEIRLEKVTVLNDFISSEDIIDELNKSLLEKPTPGSRTEALVYMYRGRAYYENGNYQKAMPDYLKAQNYFEKNKIADQEYGHLLHFIGSVFKRQDNDKEALRYYTRIIEISKILKDSALEAEGLYLSADIYNIMGDSEKDLEMSMKALNIYTAMKNFPGQGLMLMNLSHYYFHKNNYAKAKEFLDKSVEINSAHHYTKYLATTLRYYAKYYSKTGNYKLAMNYLDKANKEASQGKSDRLLMMQEVYRTMSEVQYDYGHFKEAYESLEYYHDYKDSIVNAKNSKVIHDLEAKYQNDKKEKEITLLNKDKSLNLQALKSEKQKNIFLYVELIMTAFFLIFLLSRYRLISKQKQVIQEKVDELEKQKSIVVTQNNEILSSIEYAKRIQATILPPMHIVKKHLQDSFILYLPKDIVAGDFYWMNIIQSGKNALDNIILFAACDCTGHGVPGALVSVVCSNALNRAVKEYNLTQPSLILDKVGELVVADFSKDEHANVQDGMDISLCALNTETNQLQWAGANNPIWLIRNGVLKETKGDKQPIGRHDAMLPFTNHTIDIQKGDTVYLFTDGYADQFGGTNNRKLSKSKFKELLLSIQEKPLSEQKNYLYEFHHSFRSNNEQLDDILVIGFKV